MATLIMQVHLFHCLVRQIEKKGSQALQSDIHSLSIRVFSCPDQLIVLVLVVEY